MAKAEEEKATKVVAKTAKRSWRVKRSSAFKWNVERFGPEKAKYIAAIVTKKLNGTFSYLPGDAERAKSRAKAADMAIDDTVSAYSDP